MKMKKDALYPGYAVPEQSQLAGAARQGGNTNEESVNLEAFEAVCPEVYTDAERELLWKGWQLAGQSQATKVQAVPEGWISVDERLPQPETDVLILRLGKIRIGAIFIEHESWEEGGREIHYWDDAHNDGQGWDWSEVTHWMPLPCIPTAQEVTQQAEDALAKDVYRALYSDPDYADELALASITQQAAPEAPTDGAAQLFDALASKGGAIVSTASLDAVQIAAARIEGRMYVREDGCGFVHAHPPSKGFSAEPYRKFMAEWSANWFKVEGKPAPVTQQAAKVKTAVPYQAALLAVERMRGCSATYIEDHAKDCYPGQIGLRPQDVATMWAQEIHGIDAKVYLDEAIVDLAPTTSTVSAPDEIRNAALEEAAEQCEAEKVHVHKWHPSSDGDEAYNAGCDDCAKAIRTLRTVSASGSADTGSKA